MLKEIRSASSVGQTRRRWFSGDDVDLMVWFDPTGAAAGFQLRCDKQGNERVFTWSRKKGFAHEQMNEGGADTGKKLPASMEPAGEFDLDQVRERLVREGSGVDRNIISLVLDVIAEVEGLRRKR